MQDAIQKELGLSPIEQEVVVLYEGEKESRSSEFWEVGMRCLIPEQYENCLLTI